MNTDNHLKDLNEELQKHLQKGHHVPGVTEYDYLPNFMEARIQTVKIDTNPAAQEIYHMTGEAFGFDRLGVLKFSNAGQITLSFPENAIDIRRAKGISRYTAKVHGQLTRFDGTQKTLVDAKTLDLIIKEEEVRMECSTTIDKEHTDWTPDRRKIEIERTVKGIMLKRGQYAVQAVVTGAQSRVVSKLLGLKGSYTLEELKKPFIIVHFSPKIDANDPLVKQTLINNYFGVRNDIYPHAGTPQQYRPFASVITEQELPLEQSPSILDNNGTSTNSTDLEDFNDYPRGVREGILRKLTGEASFSEDVSNITEEELFVLYRKFKEAA